MPKITQQLPTVISALRGYDYKKDKRVYLVVLLIGLSLLIFYKKAWFIAAMVNNTPISNFEVLYKMNQQYRSQTLSQLINEKLILAQARKNNITVTPSDIDKKISQIESSVGGAQILDNLLTQQNQTRQGLRDQLVIQLSIEKLYDKDATVSADQIDNFIASNKDSLRATDSAGQIKEATDTLKQQKLSQIFNDKFQSLKQSAKIQIF